MNKKNKVFKLFSLLLLCSFFNLSLASNYENLELSNSNSTEGNGIYNNVDMYNSTYIGNQTIEGDLELSASNITGNVIVKGNADLYNSTITGSLLVYGTLSISSSKVSGNIYTYGGKINGYNDKGDGVEKLTGEISADFYGFVAKDSKIKVLGDVEGSNVEVESFYVLPGGSKKDFYLVKINKGYKGYFYKVDPLLDINLEKSKRDEIISYISTNEIKIENAKSLILKEINNETKAKREKKSYDLTKLNQLKQEVFNLKYDLVNDDEIISSINNIDYDKEEFKKAQLNEIKDTITYLNSIIGNKFDNQSIKKEVNSVTSINTNGNGVSINSNGTSINTNGNGVSINSNGTSINTNDSNTSVNSNKSTDDKLKSSLRLFIEKKLDGYTDVQKSKIIEILPGKIDKIVSKTQSEKSKKTLLALKEVVIEMQEEYSNKDEINNLFDSLNNND